MFAKERLNKILRIIERKGKVLVKELAIEFDLTEDSIRKDLKHLEKEGIIERVYGGAILKRDLSTSIVSVRDRQYVFVEEKERIAKKAYSLIKDGDTIFLDISTINVFLAQEIAQGDKSLIIVTNMIDILGVFSYSENKSKIICTGGEYNKLLTGFIGSTAIDIINKFKVNKAFIASCGINIYNNTISASNIEDGLTKKAMIDNSEKVFLVSQKKKLERDGIYKFSKLDDLYGIILEDDLSEELTEILKTYEVKIY